MAQTDVCPEKLRFTQDSIKNTFKKPYDNRRIDDAVDQIGNKQLDPGVLMPLNVVNHRRVLWSLDNRRLWVLRKAGVPTVKVIWVPPNHSKRSEEFFSTLNYKLARRYSGADYFPRVRGSVRSVGIGRATGIPPALLPPNLKTGTVSIDIPISTNFETNSNSSHKESQQMVQNNVCPENLRFTQDSIKNRFKKPYDNQLIDKAVDQIRNNQLSPGVFMPLTVVHYRSVLWSLDNRRLWVLRKAGVSTVTVIFVPPNHIRRSENFFSSLSDPHLERQYSSAEYFPLVRGRCRFVGNHGVLPPPIPLQLNDPTRVNAGATQANRTPSQPPLRDITVRRNIPPLVSPLPNVDDHKKSKSFVPNISNTNSGPGGKKGSDSLWGKILNVVNCAMEKGFGFFRSFVRCNEKVVRLGLNSLLVLGFCFALRQSYNLGKGSVDSKLKNVLRAENVGKSSVSDQNINNNGYLGIVAVKAIVGVEKMTYNLLSKMSVVPNCVDLSKRVVVGSGRKASYPCSVRLRECFRSVHFITGQAAVSFGRMGIRVSEFCLEKIWELLRFIKCQAFGLPVKIVGWSVGKVQDALSFYMNEIKEFLRKVICSPQIALSFCLNKVKEPAECVISFCLNKMKEFLGLQGF